MNSIPCIASPLILCLSYFAHSYWMLGVGRFLNGVGAEICCCVASLYLTEIAAVSLRGLFGIFRGVCLFGGQLSAQVLGHPDLLGTRDRWPFLFGLGLIPAVVQLMILPFCPESPSFLYLGKNYEGKGRLGMCTTTRKKREIVQDSDSIIMPFDSTEKATRRFNV